MLEIVKAFYTKITHNHEYVFVGLVPWGYSLSMIGTVMPCYVFIYRCACGNMTTDEALSAVDIKKPMSKEEIANSFPSHERSFNLLEYLNQEGVMEDIERQYNRNKKINAKINQLHNDVRSA